MPLFNFLEVYTHMESYEYKVQRHKKELESERMKNMLPPELLDDFSTAFKRLCSSKHLCHVNAASEQATEADSSRYYASGATLTSSEATSRRPLTSPTEESTAINLASVEKPLKDSTTEEHRSRRGVIAHTAGSQICISRASFRRDILGAIKFCDAIYESSVGSARL